MTITIGYQLSSEEHGPNDLARYAQMAEEHGFTFATISDHFHPWTDTQGQSPFEEAGFDHVGVHQVGPDQAGFFRFFAREVLPELGTPTKRRRSVRARAA